jgi:hypothetical protein
MTEDKKLQNIKIVLDPKAMKNLLSSQEVINLLMKEYNKMPNQVQVEVKEKGKYFGQKHILSKGIKNRAYIKVSNKGQQGADWAHRVLKTSSDTLLRRSAHRYLARLKKEGQN